MVYSTNISEVLEIFCNDSFSILNNLEQLREFALSDIDKGMHMGMILIDLQKTFNIMDHKILLEKMSCLGFKKSLIKWS